MNIDDIYKPLEEVLINNGKQVILERMELQDLEEKYKELLLDKIMSVRKVDIQIANVPKVSMKVLLDHKAEIKMIEKHAGYTWEELNEM